MFITSCLWLQADFHYSSQCNQRFHEDKIPGECNPFLPAETKQSDLPVLGLRQLYLSLFAASSFVHSPQHRPAGPSPAAGPPGFPQGGWRWACLKVPPPSIQALCCSWSQTIYLYTYHQFGQMVADSFWSHRKMCLFDSLKKKQNSATNISAVL